MQKITLGAGCFWCVETAFRRLRGVQSAVSGYSGGHSQNPTYEAVCSEKTGHAEVVQVEYNPSVIDTEKILQVFFFVHDPTQLNRQGNDVGTQYRSAVFYHNDEQKTLAQKLIDELNASGKYNSKIVTEVTKFDKFYPAEDYHQDYFRKNPNQGYCAAVVRPKVEKFLKTYKEYLA
ncbi:unnamed protein product [Brachionus calyciflorus]|uniref:peptide-methionine (S)-S-oxide reductase n=1 Tax=Brachionus calyciflorus TaxID=104777 RepID=A0A813RV00_9BILA|nr:unnamed protein product [Brachionus calyciflorus]